ncbi:nitrilase [Siminovitchia terrae]|uniref:carbon-nitrogen hydrolase family protein n=1 Tax=Siminovitchia terrae TaxID=1914933 RepID=UPI001B06D174|nr:carbon-nitrogen hydrolase family protein [Siminovitchia terrae]GIN90641.1 nitrilase [Siminovitchia terrae]
MSKQYPKFRAAAVQAAPVFLDLDATVEKTCSIIEEATNNGAKLIGFPEAFIPGYPWWIFAGDPGAYGAPYYAELYKNAVEIPSNAVRKISETAKNTETYVCVSVTELDGGSLFLTQLWFDPSGNLIGKHRKLKPTNAERYIWGDGDGSTMPVFDTDIGRLGGLQCWEHLIPLNVTAMNSQNEQVHVASWPAFFADPDSLLSVGPNETASRYYSVATQTYTLMSSQIHTQEIIDKVCGDDEYKRGIFNRIGGGCTKIFGPNGRVISNEIAHDEEGIAYADIDIEAIIYSKYLIDPAGHYSTPSVVSLNFNQNPQPPVRRYGDPKNTSISFEQLQEEDSKTVQPI